MEIQWKDPGDIRQRGRPWSFTSEFYEQLKARPNEWALFREGTYASRAYKMRERYPDLEVTLRRAGANDNKTPLYDIYVRYVPSGEPF